MREPWFAQGDDGTLRVLNGKGCLAFLAVAAWILFSGTVGMLAFVQSPRAESFGISVLLVVIGLAVFAYFAVTRTSK